MNVTVDELIRLTKSDTIRSLRSNAKKLYKWYLCGLLKDILIRGSHTNSGYYPMILGMEILGRSHPEPEDQDLRRMVNEVMIDLDESYFIDSFNEGSVNRYLDFFRGLLQGIKEKGKTLLKVSEFDGVFKVQQYFLYRHKVFVKPHHWIDINLQQSLTHTIPEFFNYVDLLVLWNDFISKRNNYDEEIDRRMSISQTAVSEYYSSREAREIRLSYSTYVRLLITASVTFVESYLYYYFYNIKHNPVKNTDARIIGILNRPGYIQDTQIVEDIIFKLHHGIKDNLVIYNLYKSYIDVNNLRDRYTHTSAFVESSNQITQLQPLLNIEFDEVIKKLQVCIDLVKSLDHHLPDDEKVIQWWSRFEDPVFCLEEKISPLNIYM
ncbi:hypothetical protein ACIQYL_09865 [Lysinibacillus xylanilyticus]|uniref:hypothetical protein n=1 Tax=Lysinibacillus xylanilyticus TaxID=582475 RepID=UPI00382DFC1C